MTGIQLPGLATGLDTTTLITQLMQVEAQPQTLLKNTLSNTQLRITDLQSLNAKIASLVEATKKNAAPTSLQQFAVTSSSPNATATVGPGAAAGSIDFLVDSVAQPQTDVTAAYSSWPSDPPTLTFVSATGTKTEVTASSTSLNDVVSAINGSSAGVAATKIRSGSDVNGDPLYRLQFQSSETGTDGGFETYNGSAAEVDLGTAPNLMSESGAARTRPAQDAQVRLWAGTAAEQTITSASNTFSELLPGIEVNVSGVSATPVTLTTSLDTDAATQTVSDFVSSFASLISFISENAAATQQTDESGNINTTLGTFTGDSTVRDANDSLMRAATNPVNDMSPSSIGIEITKDGTITFDKEAFAAAMQEDPAAVQSMFSAITDRVQVAAKTISDPFTGTLSQEITGKKSQISGLNDQISNWDRLLASKRASLEQVYANLEVQISSMNAQRDYLQSQLDALIPPSSSTSK